MVCRDSQRHSIWRQYNKIIRLHPDISAYSLIVEKGTSFYEKYKFDMVRQEAGMRTEFLPNEDELYDMEKAGQKAFMDAGYRQYGDI